MSNRKLEHLVTGASDLSARKLRADDILISTHASDACVAWRWPKLPDLHHISSNKMCFLKSPCQMRTTPFSGSPILTAAVHFYVSLACAGVCRGAMLF